MEMLRVPFVSAEACEKSSWLLWKEKLCQYWCEKARKHMCVTDGHMTLAVKVALNPNTTNQPTHPFVSAWLIYLQYRISHLRWSTEGGPDS